jgi:hypothetical protein
VNEAAGYMETPAEQPQDQQDRENGPKHKCHPGARELLVTR